MSSCNAHATMEANLVCDCMLSHSPGASKKPQPALSHEIAGLTQSAINVSKGPLRLQKADGH